MGVAKKKVAKRALIVVRLSRVTEATTSPERQLQACRELCEQRGYEVIGVAEDLDVSAGATTPFDRPELGRWLRERHHEVDVLVFYRMDRLVRRLLDLAEMIRWAQDHRIVLVSATESFLDLTQPFGDIIALLVAKVAEMELAAIATRNHAAFTHNFRAGKWRGGVPPWGYRPERVEGEWRLVQDSEQVEVIHEVVKRVLAGEPLRAIAHDLTRRGVLTPKDRFAQLRGREVRGYEWHSAPLKRALTSRTLLGQVVGREPVLDEDGNPVRDSRGHRVLGPERVLTDDSGRPLVRADPILSRSMFDRVAKELANRENRQEPTKRTTGLLTGVLVCGVCGRRAYRLKGGQGRKPRYRCASAQYAATCENRSIPLRLAEQTLEDRLLSVLGDMERMQRVWYEGSDHSDELAEVDEALADLTDALGTGAYKRGTPQRARLDERIAALAARREELAAMPQEPAQWRYEGTGESFGQWWATAGHTERNVWLRENVSMRWFSHSEGARTVVDDIEIAMKAPDLDGGVLLRPIAELARLKSVGAWTAAGLSDLPEAMAAVWMRQGPAQPSVVEEEPERPRRRRAVKKTATMPRKGAAKQRR
ncbi:MAG TPA: recombinase family protein [Gordonia sp. (in: high G+C Gram-positive bacteria)]|nr:recombinase family protein [Gordonia sp. UBA7599]HNP58624.1 recombinase family protein [Gordonia sp. (in: high G+C Gram-positive bacteria)]HRC52545.1 recombinase family protein [Gordonia sp. (in: high G+C Gram-positive bacteria)]